MSTQNIKTIKFEDEDDKYSEEDNFFDVELIKNNKEPCPDNNCPVDVGAAEGGSKVAKSVDSDSDASETSEAEDSEAEDNISEGGSSADTIDTIELLSKDPLYLVLSKVLLGKNGDNLVDILEKINKNLKKLVKKS